MDYLKSSTRRKQTALASILALGAVVLAANVDVASAQSRQSTLLPESTLQRRGLTKAWFQRVRMDSGRDRIEHVTVVDEALFVQTRLGLISCVDAETGRIIWNRRVGTVRWPTTAVGVGPNHVAVLNGPTLIVMQRATGDILWEKRTERAPGAGPAVSRRSVFVIAANGVLQGFSIRDKTRTPWLYAAIGTSSVQPFATANSVSWPTEANYFYVSSTRAMNPRFRIELGDRIVTRPVYIRPYLYVGTLGGHLYKIHERTGTQAWRLATGSPISSKALATHERVYVATESGGVFCLAGKVNEETLRAAEEEAGRSERTVAVDGEEMWWAPSVTQLLAASPTRLYGRDDSGRTLILRADNGSLIDTLPTQLSDMTITNDRTDRIYLATRRGLIQCFHEVGLTEPVVHRAQKSAAADAENEAEDGGLDEEGFEDEEEFWDEEGFDEGEDDLFDEE
ncbi:MAG: hypothetical protein DWQ31_00600 [Planctomycetota bacterium]|nr:MAG: hypothetical protein DWQ31_00600 [Planctomycetota bacterium]REJ86689.1 MAG: hypothetical protein DWQ35_22940 [Planctomycetota bacterium]REK27139.1 MAG: hypothetical protein DWQ42_07480 [Planctomycetota bacterium]REK37865.1 MAG: hypothetical protein DWQ46_21630 [Planctomycetota bacterium]